MSSSSTPQPPKQPKPFDPARWAMALLAVLIVAPALAAFLLSVRCTFWIVPECLDRPWPALFRDWLGETIPVLIAIVMSGRGRTPPPE